MTLKGNLFHNTILNDIYKFIKYAILLPLLDKQRMVNVYYEIHYFVKKKHFFFIDYLILRQTVDIYKLFMNEMFLLFMSSKL